MHMQSVQTSIGICIYQWANDIIAHGMLRSLYSGAKIVSQSESRNCTTLTGEFFMAWESQNRSATKDTYISWTLTSKWSASMLPLHRSRYRQATEVFLGRWLLSRIQSQAIDEMSNVFHLTKTVPFFRTGSRCFQKKNMFRCMNNSHCTHHKSKWLVYLHLCLQWVTRFVLLHLHLYLYWCISTCIGISHLILISICISTCTCTCDWWYLLSSRFATLSNGYLRLPCYQSAFVITMLPICIAMLPICLHM